MKKPSIQEIIDLLGLEPLGREGGMFRSTYRSPALMPDGSNAGSAIFFGNPGSTSCIFPVSLIKYLIGTSLRCTTDAAPYVQEEVNGMNRYELTYIIDTALEENARKELIEKFSALIAQNGGEVEKVDETWGKRRLAYAINDKPEGYYVLVTFKGPSELPREIERNMGISEDVLRCLIIKLEEKKHSVKPRPVRPAAPVAAPAEAAVEAAPAAAQPAETPAAE